MANILTQRRIFKPIKPDAVSGLCSWVDVSDPATLDLNGSEIATVREKSVNGLSFTQGTSSKRPTYVKDALNGKPVLRVDGVNDIMQTATYPASFWYGTGVQQATWIYLLSYRNTERISIWNAPAWTTTTNRMILDRQPSGVGTQDFQFTAGSTGLGLFSAPYLSPTTAWAIETVRWIDGGTPSLRRTTSGRTDTYLAGSTLSGTMTGNILAGIGHDNSIAASFDLATWLIFSKHLTDTEVAGLENYIFTEWGTI